MSRVESSKEKGGLIAFHIHIYILHNTTDKNTSFLTCACSPLFSISHCLSEWMDFRNQFMSWVVCAFKGKLILRYEFPQLAPGKQHRYSEIKQILLARSFPCSTIFSTILSTNNKTVRAASPITTRWFVLRQHFKTSQAWGFGMKKQASWPEVF